jgi:hypothetical protein
MESQVTRTYYWEHHSDPSKYYRGTAAAVARIAHARRKFDAPGEVGVILDPGPDAPLQITACPLGRTVRDTTQALQAL